MIILSVEFVKERPSIVNITTQFKIWYIPLTVTQKLFFVFSTKHEIVNDTTIISTTFLFMTKDRPENVLAKM